MQITKYIHSCITVAEQGVTFLFDPGTFSFRDGAVDPERFQNVDVVFVTHNHPDHLDVAALKAIVAPHAIPVYSTAEVAEKVKAEGIDAIVFEEGEREIASILVEAHACTHQKILDTQVPTHTAYRVNRYLLNAGDSFDATLEVWKETPVLVVPIFPPFATELEVMAFIERMAPRHVLPVHDGYIQPFFAERRFDTFEKPLEKQGITLHRLWAAGDTCTIRNK